MFKLKNRYGISLLIVTFFWISNADAVGRAGGPGHAGRPGVGRGVGVGYGPGVGRGPGHVAGRSAVRARGNNIAGPARVRFVDNDRLRITKYYSATPFPVTTLPPGVARNVLRGKPLPPGVAKVVLPAGLVSQLPAYPGYQYVAVGRDVVLVNSSTNVVADVLSNVLH